MFVAGLATVRAHNVWTRSWPVAVTLLGWLAVVVGLLRMFFPSARQGGQDATTYAVIAILFIVGALLTFQGYRKAARH